MLAMHIGNTCMFVSTITAILQGGASASVGECSGLCREAPEEETSLLQVRHSLVAVRQRFPAVHNMTTADDYVAALVKDSSLFRSARKCFGELQKKWTISYARYRAAEAEAFKKLSHAKFELANYVVQEGTENKRLTDQVAKTLNKLQSAERVEKQALSAQLKSDKEALQKHSKMRGRLENAVGNAKKQAPQTMAKLEDWAKREKVVDVDDLLCRSMIITESNPSEYHVSLTDSSPSSPDQLGQES